LAVEAMVEVEVEEGEAEGVVGVVEGFTETRALPLSVPVVLILEATDGVPARHRFVPLVEALEATTSG
jgi:hypothetical protein